MRSLDTKVAGMKNKQRKTGNEGDNWIFYVMAIICLIILVFLGKDILGKAAGARIKRMSVAKSTFVRKGKTATSYKRPSVSYTVWTYTLVDKTGKTYSMEMTHFLGGSFEEEDEVHVFAKTSLKKGNRAATVSRVLGELAIFLLALTGLAVYGYFALEELGVVWKIDEKKNQLLQKEGLWMGLFGTFLISMLLFYTVMDPADAWLCKLTSGEGKNRGKTVYLGAYEQDGNAENGPEPIAWRVLAAKDGEYLLVCDSILGYDYYDNKENGLAIWSKSTLRDYLNGEFWNLAFSDEEKANVSEKTILSFSESTREPDEADDQSTDQVFLLSYQEYQKYIVKNKLELGGPSAAAEYWYDRFTEFMAEQWGWFDDTEILGITVKRDVRQNYQVRNGAGYYWVRNMFVTKETGQVVPTVLDRRFDNANVCTKIYGIRPAIWVDGDFVNNAIEKQ